MHHIMSETADPFYTPNVSLHRMWIVYADNSYDIKNYKTKYKVYIAILTLEGNGILTLKGDNNLKLTKETLVICSVEQISRYFCSCEKWHFIWFEFLSDEGILPQLDTIHIMPINDDNLKAIQNCFSTLSSSVPFSSLRASSEFCNILCSWKIELSNNRFRYTKEIEQAITYIIEHPCGNISVKELAEIVGMSERSFRNAFIQYTKMSPKKYMEQRIFNTAKELILHTSMQIKEISQSIGFTNQYYFSRAFNKHFGMSPILYKRRNNINK